MLRSLQPVSLTSMAAVLDEVGAFLVASLGRGRPSPQQLSGTLAALLGAYPPSDLLLQLARDEEACHVLSLGSFEHVNGFHKMVLVAGGGDAYNRATALVNRPLPTRRMCWGDLGGRSTGYRI